MEEFFNIALAIDNLCFWPPDNLMPFSPIIVSYLFGSFSTKSCAAANLHAFMISSFEASAFPYKIFALIVSSKSITS